MANTWHHDRKRYHPWNNPRAKHKVVEKFRDERWWYFIGGERVSGRRFFHHVDYAASPGWFRNQFMERPARRATRRLEHLAVRRAEAEAEALMWPVARKPHIFYW